ncbi:MAG: AAA family ATPase [Candidatus Marsarchaeota archaeon]|nr:AAA family ATPase [Candidatus Marsarchaeota archaeon]
MRVKVMPRSGGTKRGGGAQQHSYAQNDDDSPSRMRIRLPLSVYWLKDFLKQIMANKNFHDSIATTFAFLSLGIAFPFFPLPVFIALAVTVFALTYLIPAVGLMGLLLLTLPMIIYQAPLLAWIVTLIISASLFLGYKHYRSIAYAYALASLPLSYLGLMFEIPGFILAVLVLGFRRSAVIGVLVILIVAMVSNLANVPVASPIIYNSLQGHALIQGHPLEQYLAVTKPAASIGNFFSALSSSLGTFVSTEVVSNLFNAFFYAGAAIAYDIQYTLLQLIVWIFVAFSVANYAIKSRSPYKGAIASLFGVVIPVSAFIFARMQGMDFNLLVLVSFIATPVLLFALESMDIEVVQALDVMKRDILGKFGVALQDLTTGTSETLADVANYDETKQELKEAILGPIEHREISGAYNVKPAKGILLFGPPGTGKTLIMRALANEIRAGFFYVSASSLLSPYAGEGSQALSKIFITAKKHAPCVLFFDEIDSIAGRRDRQDSGGRMELITTLLSEMDGFKAVSDVAIVGATNVPQLLDPAILRPGRFDKILFMPLPDQPGRQKIFQHYLTNLPIAKDIDYPKLASLTNRFSAADIKNICEEVSRQVGDKAVSKREVLAIKMSDLVHVIKGTKPSTSLAQLEEYNTFRLDYERRMHPESKVEDEKRITLDDVVDAEDAKTALHEAVEVPILHPELLKKYDIGNIKGILLFGPPGTGKTMLMQAVANEIGDVHVLSISGYDISKYGPSQATAAVKEIFDRAKENAPAIVFVDEIDAIVPSRDTAHQNGLQLAGEFLEEFDKIKDTTGVVVVAATNRPDALDPAILRSGRFDRLIFMPPPGAEDRAKIFELNLEKAPLDVDVDFAKLAASTEGYTGADIANICRQVKLNTLEASLISGNELNIKLGDIMVLIQKARPSAPAMVLGRYLAFFSRYGKR